VLTCSLPFPQVRPRIKGRFAKKEEVAAWKAAERAMHGRRQMIDDSDMEEEHMVVPSYRG
jgi:hypothetical protein